MRMNLLYFCVCLEGYRNFNKRDFLNSPQWEIVLSISALRYLIICIQIKNVGLILNY